MERDCFPDVINDCTPIDITAGAGSITVTNLNVPLTQVLVLTPDFATTIDGCTNCDEIQDFSNLPAGDYMVIAKLLDASFALICEKLELVTVSTSISTPA